MPVRTPQLVEQVDEQATPVDGDASRRPGAELIVEDLQREQAVIAGGVQRIHEVDERQVALAREVAEVPAPGHQVHVEQRRVGDLHQKDLVARDAGDRLVEVGLAGEDMESVEHQPDGRMVGAPDRLPGVAVVADVAAPGQRLEGDPQAAALRPPTELIEVRGRAVDAAEAFRRHVGAHHQEIAAELLHQVELALRPREGALALVGRHALEIAERLECDDVEAEILDHAAHVDGRAVEGEKVVLEDLDALEAGGRDGFRASRRARR